MRFVRGGVLAALVPVALLALAAARAAEPVPDAYRTGGFALGCQAWCFNKYTAFEAIEKTAQTGGKVIEFYPGQRLSAEREAGVGPGMSDDDIAALKGQLAKYNIRPVAFGVTGFSKDEAEDRKTFEFARKMGIGTITAEPDPAAMDVVERLVKEYDIRVAIHNHPKRADDPSYRFWDPQYVLSLVKNRDARIGSCADTGHWVRSGIKPVDALRALKGRVLEVHLKDLNTFAPDGHDVPFGTGVSNIRGILDELRRQKFDGNLSIEYEYNWEGSVPDIAQCIGYVRGLTAAEGK
jgi:sugar phosphate isomerase/epimerase